MSGEELYLSFHTVTRKYFQYFQSNVSSSIYRFNSGVIELGAFGGT